MSRARICFLEGLPTITSIVEGFGGVPSAIGRTLHVTCIRSTCYALCFKTVTDIILLQVLLQVDVTY